MNSFEKQIAKAFENSGSDKEWNHSYSSGYAKILFDQVDVKNFLEIGLANSTIEKTSLNAWSSIYPEANIFGIDIDPEKMVENKNIKTFVVDQSNFKDLSDWAKDLGVEFDVIVDDGSHIFEHAKTSFQALFNTLRPGGVYVIEDVAKDKDYLAIPNQQTLNDWLEYLSITHGIKSYVYDCKKDSKDDSILIEIRKAF